MQISGLIYIPNYITAEQEANFHVAIESGAWQTSLKRRVQQFGPIYNYSTKKLDIPLAPIPPWLDLNLSPWFDQPDQVIINEYEPGQGISKHIDSRVFGPVIASLSLLSDAEMIIGKYSGERQSITLDRLSLLILTDEARNDWYHAIQPVLNRRISVTFRTIKDKV